MNTYNDWEYLLQLANEDLNKIGYSILITEPEEGFYDCEIWKDGELVETYAENYYENELSDLVTEVWHYTNYIKNAE
jgi:hypothetical protein